MLLNTVLEESIENFHFRAINQLLNTASGLDVFAALDSLPQDIEDRFADGFELLGSGFAHGEFGTTQLLDELVDGLDIGQFGRLRMVLAI